MLDDSDEERIPLARGGEERLTFDVIQPEDDEHTAGARSKNSGAQPAVTEAAPPRAYRPYEQLFSELRRRKGA